MKKTTVAIVGCGRIARSHFPALAYFDDVRIKYACDLIREKAEDLGEKHGAENIITDYKIALSDPEVDAVYVLTPNYVHYVVTMDALRAGKHVFCEKPVTVNYDLSVEMAKEAEKQGKLLNIGVCNRYNETVERIAELNKNGVLGNLYHVYCSFRNYRSIPGLGGPFTIKEQSGGGVLIDWGIHFIDLILYIMGGAEIKTVSADMYSEMAKNIKDYVYRDMWAGPPVENGINDVEDYVTGHIRTDKATITFSGAWAQNIDKREMFIDFLGDKAGVRMDYSGKYTLYTTRDGVLVEEQPEFEKTNMYLREDRAFIDAIHTGEHTRSHIDNILNSMKLLDYIYRSAETKREIVL
ncbi:MAG: Gfo/Idh/MocA family oxidoreductase [Firmicutes bacterium]|nr:Gfo/Idh/MocA family oxidoreductase [Bacillota bacterium]